MPGFTVSSGDQEAALPVDGEEQGQEQDEVQEPESKFVDAPEVEKIAHDLLEEHHGHLAEARVCYLFRLGPWASKGDVVLGKAYKVSDRDKYLHGYDFLIVINKDYWPALTEDQRVALVDHELCHCSRGEDTSDGFPKWEIRNRTVEEFVEVIRRHGL
ncbi:MAG: putative metallopeptidase, partial [Clostridia bacterium]|nr:putative metallopeptidase [Clostridia bacterium]